MRNLLHQPLVRRYGVRWGILLALIVLELALMALHVGLATPFVALAMAGIIVMGPMELAEAPNIARIFAFAGAFWLVVVLFGLGTLDPLTRHDQPTHFHSEP